MLAIATLDVGNALLVQAARELCPLAHNDPERILRGGWVLGQLGERSGKGLGRLWLRFFCCAGNTAALSDHLDRSCSLAGVKLKQATIVVRPTVASAYLGKDPTALTVAHLLVWPFRRV